jgi:putative transposase
VAGDRGDVRRDAHGGSVVGLGAPLCDGAVSCTRLRPQARPDRQQPGEGRGPAANESLEARVAESNGSYPKTVTTEIGQVTIDVPRDRSGTFEPVLVPKGQRRLDGLDTNVISLYAKGMTTGDIQAYLGEIYGTEISRDTISRITDAIVEEMKTWQNRPLDRVYPVVLIDAIVVKIRDGQVANRPVYVAIGINMDGERDVLGMWVGPTGGEGAKYWMMVLTELRNRGLLDALIVCCDGLKGLPESIRTTWPLADVQLCVVHLVRSALRYTSKKYGGKVCADLREIYTAPTLSAAEDRFVAFCDTWKEKCPAMVAVRERSWNEFVPFLDFHVELRKLVYTTNSIESLNARFRKAARHRSHFPTEQAALKVLYLVAIERRPNRAKPHRPRRRLEEHSQRPHHPLRRPRRPLAFPMSRPAYTDDLPVPLGPTPIRELRFWVVHVGVVFFDVDLTVAANQDCSMVMFLAKVPGL